MNKTPAAKCSQLKHLFSELMLDFIHLNQMVVEAHLRSNECQVNECDKYFKDLVGKIDTAELEIRETIDKIKLTTANPQPQK